MLGSAKTNLPLLTLTSWVKGTSSFTKYLSLISRISMTWRNNLILKTWQWSNGAGLPELVTMGFQDKVMWAGDRTEQSPRLLPRSPLKGDKQISVRKKVRVEKMNGYSPGHGGGLVEEKLFPAPLPPPPDYSQPLDVVFSCWKRPFSLEPLQKNHKK